MKLNPKVRRKSDDSGLIPMINVVFLLLIFFMVAGVVESSPPLDVSLPESTHAEDPLAQRLLYVSADGKLALDGEEVSEVHLASMLQEPLVGATDQRQAAEDPVLVKDGNAEGVDAAALNSDSDRTQDDVELPLGLRADATITMKRLKEVMGILRSAGVAEVELLTTWVPAASN